MLDLQRTRVLNEYVVLVIVCLGNFHRSGGKPFTVPSYTVLADLRPQALARVSTFRLSVRDVGSQAWLIPSSNCKPGSHRHLRHCSMKMHYLSTTSEFLNIWSLDFLLKEWTLEIICTQWAQSTLPAVFSLRPKRPGLGIELTIPVKLWDSSLANLAASSLHVYCQRYGQYWVSF